MGHVFCRFSLTRKGLGRVLKNLSNLKHCYKILIKLFEPWITFVRVRIQSENRREIHILKIVKNIFQVLFVCAGSHPASDFFCHLLYLDNGGVMRILRVLRWTNFVLNLVIKSQTIHPQQEELHRKRKMLCLCHNLAKSRSNSKNSHDHLTTNSDIVACFKVVLHSVISKKRRRIINFTFNIQYRVIWTNLVSTFTPKLP